MFGSTAALIKARQYAEKARNAKDPATQLALLELSRIWKARAGIRSR